MTETLANGYSSESTQRGLSNEYQHDRVSMVFRNLCVLVLWMKVALALEGLTHLLLEVSLQSVIWIYGNFENTFRNKSDFAKKN